MLIATAISKHICSHSHVFTRVHIRTLAQYPRLPAWNGQPYNFLNTVSIRCPHNVLLHRRCAHKKIHSFCVCKLISAVAYSHTGPDHLNSSSNYQCRPCFHGHGDLHNLHQCHLASQIQSDKGLYVCICSIIECVCLHLYVCDRH